MKRLITLAAMAAVLAGCSTAQTRHADTPLPSPTPAVTKDQTVAAQGKLDAPMTIDLPAWYIKAPASTEDYVYLAGTGVSNDLSMSQQKALLDAQLKLADKINGIVNALVKSYKDDSQGTVNSDKTSVAIKKVITDTAITGYHIEDSKIQTENRGYRTFVLLRYPIGDANRMLKDKLQRENMNSQSEDSAQRELENEIQARKPRAQTRVAPVEVAPVESKPLSQRADELPHNTISDAGVKKRVEDAIARGDAVIVTETAR